MPHRPGLIAKCQQSVRSLIPGCRIVAAFETAVGGLAGLTANGRGSSGAKLVGIADFLGGAECGNRGLWGTAPLMSGAYDHSQAQTTP